MARAGRRRRGPAHGLKCDHAAPRLHDLPSRRLHLYCHQRRLAEPARRARGERCDDHGWRGTDANSDRLGGRSCRRQSTSDAQRPATSGGRPRRGRSRARPGIGTDVVPPPRLSLCHRGDDGIRALRARDARRPAAQHLDVRPLRQRRADLPAQHHEPPPDHPGPVLGGRRAHDPLPAGQAARGGAVGADRLPDHEVDRPQHHGGLRGRDAVHRQSRRQELDGAAAGLPHPDEDGARWRRHPADPGRLEAGREDDPGQQCRLHGRLPRQGRHHVRGARRPSARSRRRTSSSSSTGRRPPR